MFKDFILCTKNVQVVSDSCQYYIQRVQKLERTSTQKKVNFYIP